VGEASKRGGEWNRDHVSEREDVVSLYVAHAPQFSTLCPS